MTTYKIACIAGDGIDKEVMPEGLRVLQAANQGPRTPDLGGEAPTMGVALAAHIAL